MARRLLIAAALCLAAGALVYLVAMHVPAARAADRRVLEGFMGLDGAPGSALAPALAGLFNPAPFAVLWTAVLALAFATGRRREGVAVALAMGAASVTSQVLKPLLGVPRVYMETGSWPSGHTTAVMSLTLAMVVISPPRLRPLAAASGGVLTVLTVYSLLVLGTHYPSDVLGGFLVATFWICLATAALRVEALPSRRTLAAGPALGAGALAAGLAAAVAARPEAALTYAGENPTFVVGALAIAAGALVLSGSVPAPTAAPPHPPPRSRRARG